MNITVFCPHCRSRYQLDPSLLGKRMRCPNTICRMVFEVRPEGSLVTPPRSENDLGIPNDIENDNSSEGERRGVSPPVTEPFVEKVWNSNWEPPPIRSDGATDIVEEPAGLRRAARPLEEPAARPAEEPAGLKPAARQASRLRPLVLITTMLVILGGILGGGLYIVMGKGAVNEAERFKKAQELYQNQEFEEATGAFQKLLRDFPKSKNRPQYDFLVELSAVREAVYGPRDRAEERGDALKNVRQFLEIYKNDPLLKEYHGDIWHTLQRLARELTTLAEQKQDVVFLNDARRSWAEAGKFTPPAGPKVDEVTKALQGDFTRVEALLAVRTARLELLEVLRDLKARGSADAVRAGRLLAKNAGMENDSEVTPLLEDLLKAHRAKVVFNSAESDNGPTARRLPEAGDDLASYYLSPKVGKIYTRFKGTSEGEPHVVLALARGILFALDAEGEKVLWGRRVGVDTHLLPLRVPPSAFMPELVLVVSSDSKSVSAVNAVTGAVVWQHALNGVCLGQPVLVDRHLLIPTLTGDVEEIETTGGTWQGSYSLGQPLVVGGVRQPGTTLVVFPADSYCVYVLDVAKRICAAVLYTGHPPGSLRGVPVIWNETQVIAGNAGKEGWLLLNQASGGERLNLRPYSLPIRQADQKPADLQIQIPGDSEASPRHEGDRLALATDAGLLALFGIRQKGNNDPLLFRLLAEDYRLESEVRARRGRSLVVHADADDYWVVTGGKLHRMTVTFTLKSGPGLVARWPQPLEVGSPLHAGQVSIGPEGKAALVLVTQELDKPTCWIRAIAAEDGQVLWQRQLGMVISDQPVRAADTVLCQDSRGVFLLPDIQNLQPTGAFFEDTGKPTGHWSCAYGSSFVNITWGPEPVLRLRILDKKEIIEIIMTKTFPLPALPLGTPALGSDFVLLPLANGTVFRVPLGEGSSAGGPDWRGVGVEETQPGHIVALGNNDFALTDGGRALARYHWGDAKVWEKQGTVELPHRIIAAPAVLGNWLVVADASDTVTLLEGERLQTGQRWSLGAKITAGPFVRGGGVGLVVGKKRLVWVDPGKDQPAWEYDFVAPVVGQPQLVDDMLVVADLQGGILGIHLATGQPVGPGYRLKANEAPTVAPLPFGKTQVFMPLMDGTAMILPLAKLR